MRCLGHFWDHITEASLQEEHANFTDFLAHIWGGPVHYRGRDMVTAHRGMGVADEHWNALFQVIRECNTQFGVPEDLVTELEESLQRLKPGIVGSPTYRQVILDHPDIDITKGMKSVGVVWPERRPTATSFIRG